jgi:hypothetical protein
MDLPRKLFYTRGARVRNELQGRATRRTAANRAEITVRRRFRGFSAIDAGLLGCHFARAPASAVAHGEQSWP